MATHLGGGAHGGRRAGEEVQQALRRLQGQQARVHGGDDGVNGVPGIATLASICHTSVSMVRSVASNFVNLQEQSNVIMMQPVA